MKRKLLPLLVIVLNYTTTFATLIHTENFNYSAGSLLEGQGTPVWTVSTKTFGVSSPLISTNGLAYNYYGPAGTGKGVSLTDVTADRTSYQFFSNGNTYSSGTLYVAFLLKVTTPSANPRDFITFEGSTGTTQRARLYIQSSGTGYKLGITRIASTPTYWIDNFVKNETYLIVVKYTINSGTCDDVATLYAKFPLGYSEMATVVQAASISSADFDAANADPSAIKGISVKQRVGGAALQISNIRIATTWDESVNYTGPVVEPEDPNQPIYHFKEGFDSNGAWTTTGGASVTVNHGDYGSIVRSNTFNVTETTNRCNNAQLTSPAVNTAGVLRFWMKGSSSVTQANVWVEKVVNGVATEIAFIPKPIGSTWVEHMVIVNDLSTNIRIRFTVNDCVIGAGSLYIDDVSLTDFKGGNPPAITDIATTPTFPDTKNGVKVSATIVDTDDGGSVQEAYVLWGYSMDNIDQKATMTKGANNLYTSSIIPALNANQTVYYQVVALDNLYVQGKSDIYDYYVYKGYKNSISPFTIEAGNSYTFSAGLTNLRINYKATSGAANFTLSNAGTDVENYTQSGDATSGDISIICEQGQNLVLTNNGITPLAITAFLYDDFNMITFTKKPVTLQLYPRDVNNNGNVLISGVVNLSTVSSITVRAYREGIQMDEQTESIDKLSEKVAFNFTFSIVAEKAQYSFEYFTNINTTPILLADKVVAGDVYMIAGQSNGAASGSGNVNTINNYWRNFGCVQKEAPYNPADTLWGLSNSEGWGYGRQFYNGYSGYVIQRNLLTNQNIPTALLNISVGGSSIEQNLRNNSNPEDLSTFYGRGLYRAEKAGIRDAVKAIIWVQGESNQSGGYIDYASKFNQIYQAWKEDYPGLQQVYVSQINMGCGTGTFGSELREVQRQLADTYDDVTVITNIGIEMRYDSCHYTDSGYEKLYTQYSNLLEQEFYSRSFTKPLTSPMVKTVTYADEANQSIAVSFDQAVVLPPVLWNRNMKDYFFDQSDNKLSVAELSLSSDNKTVTLELIGSSSATHLTYGPDSFVFSPTRGMDTIYVDPWIRNDQGYAALTFNRVPIASYTTTSFCNEKVNDGLKYYISDNFLVLQSQRAIQYVQVLNSQGQVVAFVLSKNEVYIKSLPIGMYVLKVGYTDGSRDIEKFINKYIFLKK